MLDGVEQRLLRYAVHGQLDLGRRTRDRIHLEPDVRPRASGQPVDQPLQRRPGTEVLQDGQLKVVSDGPQVARDGSRDCGVVHVAGRVELLDQQRYVAQRPVVERGGQAVALRL
jgi:hypothetical protein